MSREDHYLKRSLTVFEEMAASWRVTAIELFGTSLAKPLDAGMVKYANALYSSLFDRSLPDLTNDALADLPAYLKKIENFENYAALPETPVFDAKENYERLIEHDLLRRREKNFVIKAMLSGSAIKTNDSGKTNGSGDAFRVVDFGSGGGRIFYEIADILSRIFPTDPFQVIGLEENHDNTQYATSHQAFSGNGKTLMHITSDATAAPLQSGSVSMSCLNSVMQLIPVYKRPLLMMELVRILKTNGEGVITGPNEKCTLDAYIRSALAAQPGVYLNPARMLMAMKMIPFAVTIDELCQKRTDYGYPDTKEICTVLEKLGCTVIQTETWPAFYPEEDIFSGIWFKKGR